jgi:hypothetical protein
MKNQSTRLAFVEAIRRLAIMLHSPICIWAALMVTPVRTSSASQIRTKVFVLTTMCFPVPS